MVQNILDTERAHVSELQVRFVCIQSYYFNISLLVINWMGINLEKPLKHNIMCLFVVASNKY